jgi:phage portal protein BeeE
VGRRRTIRLRRDGKNHDRDAARRGDGCVSIPASDAAKIPLDVFRWLSNGGKEVLKDHYLHRLLRAPND